jgi:RNA polymerase sigma-70 factor (ECF subfamily)
VSEDDALIERAKQGDSDAWRDLYRSHAGRLVVWLRSRPSGDAAVAAEDIAAEAWVVAASKVADFHGTSSDFAGWLFAIARQQGANVSRRATRRRTEPSSDRLPDPGTADGSSAISGQDWIRSVLARLPRREQEVIACLEVVGLDVAATALALEISATAVRVARHRGLKRLRALGVLAE